MLRGMLSVVLASSIALVVGCKSSPGAADTADTIYYGGDIVTVNEAQPKAEAVAVKDGKILMVGSQKEIEDSLKGPTTTMVDLAGKTLTSSFIDGHSHFADSLSMADRVNVSAPPVGPARNPEEIIKELVTFAKAKEPGELVIGYGYDENLMPKGHPLTRFMLDKALPDNPVIVIHVSSHGAVLNSAAFAKFGYKDGMKTPEAGVIARKAGTQILEGLVMETAYLPVFSALPVPTPDQELIQGKAAQGIYAKAGITTVQEGATHLSQLEVLQRLAAHNVFYLDINSYPFITDLEKILAKNPPSTFGTYKNRLKLAGCKIVLDGSPQGKTAAFTTPYLTGGPAGEKNWKGEPSFPQDYVNATVKKCYDNGLQVLMHANGDAAVDVAFKAHEYAAAGSLDKDRRTVIIHSQFVRKDQLPKYVQYKLIPSFFTDHVFLFGDTHLKNRGMEQAGFMSPMRAAIDLGLRPTNHTDYPVAPTDQMLVMWTAVNRVTRDGVVLGADQRITPLEALKAITINGAYQYGEQATKGSIETGKLADLVILDKDPLTVPPMAIKDIQVVETIKEGKTVYKAN